MTDFEKTKALFAELGLEPQEQTGYTGGTDLTLEAKKGPKVVGYTHFLATFEFEPDGTFISVGIWE